MDGGVLRAARKRLTSEPAEMVRQLHYVLVTANNWRGAIDNFKLTIDKGVAVNLVSLCRKGIVKTGPTTFEFKAKDFVTEAGFKDFFVEPPAGRYCTFIRHLRVPNLARDAVKRC